jgi:hypothetical protein
MIGGKCVDALETSAEVLWRCPTRHIAKTDIGVRGRKGVGASVATNPPSSSSLPIDSSSLPQISPPGTHLQTQRSFLSPAQADRSLAHRSPGVLGVLSCTAHSA